MISIAVGISLAQLVWVLILAVLLALAIFLVICLIALVVFVVLCAIAKKILKWIFK